MDIASVEEAIGKLAAAADSGQLTNARDLVSVERMFSRLEAAMCHVVSGYESSGEWAADGSRSMGAWLEHHCALSKREAARQRRLGRCERQAPRFYKAFSDGSLTGDHVQAAARIPNPRTQEAFARDEALLLDQARCLSFADFMKVLAYFEQLADPDGTEEHAEAQRARRSLSLSQTIDCHWLLTGWLDPISGSIVASELQRLESKLFEEDWAEAEARLGRKPMADELVRTVPQRRLDALVDMARRSASRPDGATASRPLISVLVDFPTLSGRICELSNGTVVSPGSLLPYLDEALVERAVFGPANRVEVGTKARLFTGATRRAVQLRDRRCTYPGCDVPMDECQVDHVVPYDDGGPTTQDNGRLRCRAHNFHRLHGLDDKEARLRDDPTVHRGGMDKDVNWRFSNLEWEWGEDAWRAPPRE